MDDDKIKAEFDEMTESMKVEKLFDDLADRAEAARIIAMHAATIYKTARKAGLPRRQAAYMAKEYWDYEVKPANVMWLEEGE